MATDGPLYEASLSDRVYWGALLLFGLVILGEGTLNVVTAVPDLSTYGTLLGGALVAGSAVVSLRYDYTLQNNLRPVLMRLLAVGGVVVYVTFTAVELLG